MFLLLLKNRNKSTFSFACCMRGSLGFLYEGTGLFINKSAKYFLIFSFHKKMLFLHKCKIAFPAENACER